MLSTPRTERWDAIDAHRALYHGAPRLCKLALDKRDMDALWQQERVRRANDHDISCTEVNCIDNGFVFTVIGTTGE